MVAIYMALRWVSCVLHAGWLIDSIIMGSQQALPFSNTSRLDLPIIIANHSAPPPRALTLARH